MNISLHASGLYISHSSTGRLLWSEVGHSKAYSLVMGLETVVYCVPSDAGQAPFHASHAAQGLSFLEYPIDVLNRGSISGLIHLQGEGEALWHSAEVECTPQRTKHWHHGTWEKWFGMTVCELVSVCQLVWQSKHSSPWGDLHSFLPHLSCRMLQTIQFNLLTHWLFLICTILQHVTCKGNTRWRSIYRIRPIFRGA